MSSMSLIKKLPQKVTDWMTDEMTPAPIYYKNHTNFADCRCGKCNETYQIRFRSSQPDSYESQFVSFDEKPIRFQPTTCRKCGNKGNYEWSRVIRAKYEYKSFFYFQRTTDNNMVIRVFRVYKEVCQGRTEKVSISEVRRYLATMNGPEFWKNDFKWTQNGWKQIWEPTKNGSVDWQYCDGVYKDYESELDKSNLKYCPLGEIVNQLSWSTNRTLAEILIAYSRNPAIEMFHKIGLKKIVSMLVANGGKSALINRKGKNLKAQLRIKDKQRINELVKADGKIDLLKFFQLEEKTKTHYSKDVRDWCVEHFLNHEKEIRFLQKYMSLEQLKNRVEKYSMQEDKTAFGIIMEYYDYIKMRVELGYDMNNSVYVYPKNLKKKHDAMVKEQNARKDELHITNKLKEFPKIAERFLSLNKKYRYKKDGYIIRPAVDAKEIIMEGRILHHCVGGDTYLKKHNKGETSILFLRKESEPDKPYITIEIKDTEIKQWYGAHDKKPDKEIITQLLEEYCSQIGQKKNTKKAKKEQPQLLEAV